MESFSDTKELFLKELSSVPAIFHLAGKKFFIPIIVAVLFSGAFSVGTIYFNQGDTVGTVLPLVMLGVIILLTVLYMLLFFRRATSLLVPFIFVVCVAITIILRPKFINVALAFFALYAIVCLIVTKSAYNRAKERSERLLAFEKERIRRETEEEVKLAEKANRLFEPKPEEPQEIVYCPTCGFTLMPGEKVCVRCHPEAQAEVPKPQVPVLENNAPMQGSFVPLEKPVTVDPETEESKKQPTGLGVAPSMFSTNAASPTEPFNDGKRKANSPFKPLNR